MICPLRVILRLYFSTIHPYLSDIYSYFLAIRSYFSAIRSYFSAICSNFSAIRFYFSSISALFSFFFRYDYLEFTASDGVKFKYDKKVGTSKWPLSVTFSNCQTLNFVFHSDASGNYWGYKFKVRYMRCRII